jgi:hypothetical protein
MAKLETLTKEAYDALSDELKTYYVVTKEGTYELDGIGELKRALAEEKAKRTTKPELLTELEELKKFKADHEADKQKAAQADLEAKGKYDEALAAKEKAWTDRLAAEGEKNTQLLTRLHREAAKAELIKRGALPDRVDYLANEIVDATDFALEDAGPKLTKKGGVGDAAEFDTWTQEIKAAKPFFFAANGASGSGASGSGGTGGSGKTITRAQYDANPGGYGSQLAKGELTITE